MTPVGESTWRGVVSTDSLRLLATEVGMASVVQSDWFDIDMMGRFGQTLPPEFISGP